jgi:hypothetical protein
MFILMLWTEYCYLSKYSDKVTGRATGEPGFDSRRDRRYFPSLSRPDRLGDPSNPDPVGTGGFSPVGKADLLP